MHLKKPEKCLPSCRIIGALTAKIKTSLVKLSLLVTVSLVSAPGLNAHENSIPGWEVSIPGSILDGAPAEPVAKPPPIPFEVLTSQTKRVYVTEASEMADLPPVEGVIDITVETVKDPGLADLPTPLVAADAPDAAFDPETGVQTLEDYSGSGLVLLSASVYGHSRTFLTVSLSGTEEGQVSAWSNIDFNHMSGFCTFRVTKEDGSMVDYSLLMGIGNEEGGNLDPEQLQIPNLPDLADGGPRFLIAAGDTQGEGMRIITQLHELYRKEGARLQQAFHAREEAHAARRAYLLANPPVPADVTIQIWKRNIPLSEIEQGGEP